MKLQLRDYQKPARHLVFDYLRNNPDKNPLVALPTGSGKTACITDIVNHAHKKWKTKILVISHVKEILEQNYTALRNWTNLSIGLYSSGLASKTIKDVTVAGIQSIYKKQDLFKDCKFIIVDECHLINPNNTSMYQKFFSKMENTRICGFSATPFRLGQGYLTTPPNNIFHDIVYDLTSMDNFNKLVKDGYLCNLISKGTGTRLDPEGIKKVQGDYSLSDLSDKFDRDFITNKAVDEIIEAGKDYKKWLIFAIDIEHADHIAEKFNEKGISAMSLHSKSEVNRGFIIEQFKKGNIRALINVNVLTTGFDVPDIDLIGLLRPTTSPVLHVQAIGRGMRIADKKAHCLVLDFAGNTMRLGPINDVHVETKRKTKGGDAPAKECPECSTVVHIKTKICPGCNHEFLFIQKISSSTKEVTLIAKDEPIWHNVDDIRYSNHSGYGSKPDILKVTYTCGLKRFDEYVCLQHKGYAGYLARRFISRRMPEGSDLPSTVNQAVILSQDFTSADRILVKEGKKYPEIMRYSLAKQSESDYSNSRP